MLLKQQIIMQYLLHEIRLKKQLNGKKTNKEEQEAILNCIKTSIMQEKKHQELSDK